MSGYYPEALAVRMANGDDLIVTAVDNLRVCLKSSIVTAKGGWVHVNAKGYGPCGLWLNTSNIVSIKEVDA